MTYQKFSCEKTSQSNRKTLLRKLWTFLSFLDLEGREGQGIWCQEGPSHLWVWWVDDTS